MYSGKDVLNMNEQVMKLLDEGIENWVCPEIPADIPHGDMPGDSVKIDAGHIAKSKVLFPELLKELKKVFETTGKTKAVVAVCGGSGVGKSETASLFTYYLNQMGIGAYTMSGDNYPRRIPMYNDAERVRVFRNAGVRGMISSCNASPAQFEVLRSLQRQEIDSDPLMVEQYPWLAAYQRAGRDGLSGYLGTPNEQDFDEVSFILDGFHNGSPNLWLKRMGRDETALWYDLVDFSNVSVLVLEWTHGNNRNIRGVDIPVLLNSTPEETREHRRSRNRDGKVDSSFTTMVLEIEQKLLESQADRAKIIISKQGELLTYAQYRKLMAK